MAKSETASSIRDAAGAMAAKAQAAMASDSDTFAKHAAMSDLYEIQAANIALARGKRADVKEFARKMIHDHTHTSEELKAALLKVDVHVTPPHSLDTIHQTLIDDLNGAKDEDFDGRYLAQQESAHSTALTLFRTYRDSGDKAILCAYARQTIPALESHLELVQRMKSAT